MSIERTNPITGTEAQRRWMQTNAAIIEAAEEGASIGAQELHTSVDGAGLERIFRSHKNIGRTYHLGTVANEAAMLALDSPLTSHACLPGDTCFRTDTQQIMRCVSNYGVSVGDWEVVSSSADPAGTASAAVSAHNTATDAHADIREILAGKQAAGSYLTTTGTAADSAKLGGVAASEYSQTSHTHTFTSLTSKPTTLAGYGITDAATVGHTHTQESINSTAGWITDALANKQPTIAAGTTSQYYRGDKTFQDFATSVRAAILTGLNTSKLSSREVLSTDSLLSAIGLLQGQLTSIVEQNYYAQAGDTKLEIPLSYTGTGTGVLTLRLLSDIAQTATIDGAGKFYSDSAGTLNESTSFAMSANAWTVFYIRVPSRTCNVTIPNGYAIRAFGNSANPLVTETNNGPKINGLSTSKIRSGMLVVYLYTQLNLGILSGQTYPWLNATLLFFNGNAMTISGVAYPWVNATQVLFNGNAMTLSGVTYPWVNATLVYFSGNALTITAN